MKEITLKRLKINNFKGIKSLDISFEGKETYITGDNASGKTTVFDAFTWLLFDKDSDNRTDFSIKPLDKNNMPIRVDVEVCGEFEIDGVLLLLKKTYKEKWTTKRGTSEETFTGNETLYEVDDVPYKKNDYKKLIEDKFTNEDLFKLLTNPLYFSTQIKWKDAREIVLSIAGEVDIEDVIDYKPELEPIKDEVINKGVDNLLKSKKATMKKLADQKKEIPIRIAEQQRMLTNISVEDLKDAIKLKNAKIESLEQKASGIKNNVDEINALHDKRTIKDTKLRDIRSVASERTFKVKNELREKISSSKAQERELRDIMNEYEAKQKTLENELKVLKIAKDKYADEYSEAYKAKADLSTIKENCPYCGKPLDNFEEEKEKYLELFNSDRAKKLENITTKGKETAKKIEDSESELKDVIDLKTEQFKKVNKVSMAVMELQKELDQFDNKPIYTSEELEQLKGLEENIKAIDEEIENAKNNSNSEEKEKYKALISEHKEKLEVMLENLGKSKVDDEIKTRITDLEEKEKGLVKELACIERDIELCELFIKSKVDILEGNINKHFNGVDFKLFETQVNGGINECCQVMVDGVPFNDLNTAKKINSGLAIINTVSKHHEIKLPIFIDNRESIILLENVDTQIINLRADNVEELQISGGTFND